MKQTVRELLDEIISLMTPDLVRYVEHRAELAMAKERIESIPNMKDQELRETVTESVAVELAKGIDHSLTCDCAEKKSRIIELVLKDEKKEVYKEIRKVNLATTNEEVDNLYNTSIGMVLSLVQSCKAGTFSTIYDNTFSDSVEILDEDSQDKYTSTQHMYEKKIEYMKKEMKDFDQKCKYLPNIEHGEKVFGVFNECIINSDDEDYLDLQEILSDMRVK